MYAPLVRYWRSRYSRSIAFLAACSRSNVTSPVNGWVIFANSWALNTVLPTTSYRKTFIRSVVGEGILISGAGVGDRGVGRAGNTLGVGWGNRSICGGCGGVVWAMAGDLFEPTMREMTMNIAEWVMKFFNLLPVGN